MISTASVVGFCLLAFFISVVRASARPSSRLFEGVELGIVLVSSLPRQRRLDSRGRNPVLFRQPVRQHSRDPAVKEVENPIIHVVTPRSQFMDAVAEKIGFRSAKLVSQFC